MYKPLLYHTQVTKVKGMWWECKTNNKLNFSGGIYMLNKKEVVTLTNEQKLELALNKALRGNVTEEVLEEAKQADQWTTVSKTLLLSYNPRSGEKELDEDGTVVLTATFKSNKEGVEVEVEEISACKENRYWTYYLPYKETYDDTKQIDTYATVSCGMWDIYVSQYINQDYTIDFDLLDLNVFSESGKKIFINAVLDDIEAQIGYDEESRQYGY